MRKRLDDKGYALVLVLLFVTVIAVSMVGLSLKMTNDLKQTDREQNSQGAYYVAEGGVADVMQTMQTRAADLAVREKNSAAFFAKLESEFLRRREVGGFQSNNGEIPKAEVVINKVDNEIPRTYKIESTGTIGNRERKVAGMFAIDYQEGETGITFPPGMGIYSSSTVTLSGSASVKGDLLMDVTSEKSVSLNGGASIIGTVKVPPGAKQPTLDVPHWWNDHPKIETNYKMPVYELPPFPVFPNYSYPRDLTVNGHKLIDKGDFNVTSKKVDHETYNLESNISLKTMSFKSNNTINLNIGDKDKAIVLENLDLSNGNINVIGNGSLTLYIKDEFTIGSGSTINSSNQADVYMYVGPSEGKKKKISIGGGQTVNASIYAADADLSIGAGATYSGLLITGGSTVSVSGGAYATSDGDAHLIYAPNADVELGGGGTLKGTVISKLFKASGGASLSSSAYDIGDHPMFPGGDNEPAKPIIHPPNLKEVE